jgi:hypothetical protein
MPCVTPRGWCLNTSRIEAKLERVIGLKPNELGPNELDRLVSQSLQERFGFVQRLRQNYRTGLNSSANLASWKHSAEQDQTTSKCADSSNDAKINSHAFVIESKRLVASGNPFQVADTGRQPEHPKAKKKQSEKPILDVVHDVQYLTISRLASIESWLGPFLYSVNIYPGRHAGGCEKHPMI